MSLRLVGFEIKKLVEQPIIFLFLFGCLLFNTGLLLTLDVNDDYLNSIKQVNIKEGQKVTPELKENILSKEKNQRVKNDIKSVEDIYDTLQGEELSKKMIDVFQVQGNYREKLEEKYQQLNPVITQLSKEKAALDIALGSETLPVFNHLKNVVLKALLIESLIFACLISLFSSTAEKLTKTDKLLLTSKIGRKVQVNKYTAGICLSLLFYITLHLFSLSTLFLFYPMTELLDSSVSTYFLTNIYENNLLFVEIPFITWLPMSIKNYVIFSILLGLGLLIIYFTLFFFIGLCKENMAKGLGVAIVLFCVHKGLVSYTSSKMGYFFLLLMFSPQQVLENYSFWFTETGPYTIMPFQETVVVSVSLVLLSGFSLLFSYFYSKKEVL
ncbi:hypothetical protein P7H60_07090 [Vagococcus carniphilus]|uniref:hypothetical protein n=1 Tax=Vagococcus carniphilus TaxID=218144 RepID=UPI00288F8BA2|nr:hypothetical protein [Vagococcus carniphilus]MDT2848925.1 hypothetical protein [Vagococcus carniphilus]